MLPKHILYIHGFNSSPLSDKAQITRQYLHENFPLIHFHCPQLIAHPCKAKKQLEEIISQHPSYEWGVMGSSLGGYYADYLAHKYKVKAVLINPAVKPYELLVDYMGEQTNPYTEEVYHIEASFIQDLIDIEVINIVKNRYMVMVQTGDEVLDYQQAVTKYQGCELIIEEGGDHRFINYETKLPQVFKFLECSV